MNYILISILITIAITILLSKLYFNQKENLEILSSFKYNLSKLITILKLNKKYKLFDLKIENKINYHVLYINLDRSLDRKKYIEDQFALYDLKYTKISAIDGNDINDFYKDKLPNTNFSFINNYENNKYKLSKYELGCTLSHIKAIKYAYDNNFKEVLIMEDDCNLDLTFFWNKPLNDIVNKAPKDWGIIQLFYFFNKEKINNFNKFYNNENVNNPKPCSTLIYLINKKGMKDILDAVFHKNTITLGSNVDGKLYPKKGVADEYLYDLTTTYRYTTPLFLVGSDLLQSTIDSSRNAQHTQITDIDISYYNRFNIVDIYELQNMEKQFLFAQVLYQVDELLKNNNINYFLSHDTLLNIHKYDEFNTNNNNIYLSVMDDKFKKINFDDNFVLIEYNDDKIVINHINNDININFVNKMNFINKVFNIPKDIENYLKNLYGVQPHLYPKKIKNYDKPIIWVYSNNKDVKLPKYLEKFSSDFYIILLDDNLFKLLNNKNLLDIDSQSFKSVNIIFSIIEKYGGILINTDNDNNMTKYIKIIKNDLTEYNFVGFKNKNILDLKIFGGKKNNRICKYIINSYKNKIKLDNYIKDLSLFYQDEYIIHYYN